MLSRYTMSRHRTSGSPPLPEGIRQDCRWRTRHILRPTEEMVECFLQDTTSAGFKQFQRAYRALLAERYKEDPEPFCDLAKLAERENVYLGCNCPTAKNPNVQHCHTWLALEFMQQTFPKLKVCFPPPSGHESSGGA